MDSTKKKKKRADVDSPILTGLTACGLILLLCNLPSAHAAEFHGGLNVGVLNTDNIFLLPAPDQVSETVYQVTPFLSVDYNNERIDATLRYRFDWYDYSKLNATNHYQRYDAKVSGELVQDSLYLDLGGSRSQSLVDPDLVIPSGGMPISNNLADRDEYYVSPRFEKTLGQSVTVLANYRYADISYGRPDYQQTLYIQGNTNKSASFEIQNYRREEGFTWAARYSWQETKYEFSIPWEYRRASAELGHWISSKARVFASGGKESAWDDQVDRSLQDPFWEAGFAYRNGEKLDAEFAAGKRSFGSSWRGRIDFTFPRGGLNFAYAQTPTTTGLDRYARGNLLNPDEPNDFLTQPGRAERYISKRGQVGLRLNLRRTTFGVVGYDETRTGRFLADGTPLNDVSQRGVSLSFRWDLGVRTEVLATGGVNRRENETGGQQDYVTGSLLANYRLGSYVGLSLRYDYTEEDPAAGSVGRDYVANVASLFLTYTF